MTTLTPDERAILIAAVSTAWLRLMTARATEAGAHHLLLAKLVDARTISLT
jgi:hypothetical protein